MRAKSAFNTVEANWRPVVGYEEYYSVSDCGRVRSEPRHVDTGVGRGKGVKFFKGRELAAHLSVWGYPFVVLCVEQSRKNFRVHRLVAEAFLAPRPDWATAVNHKDGDRRNNHVSNLEWVTHSENTKHAVSVLKRRMGRPKMTDAAVRELRALHAAGAPRRELMARFGIGRTQVTNICQNKSWVGS